jgi:hypothetical protein
MHQWRRTHAASLKQAPPPLWRDVASGSPTNAWRLWGPCTWNACWRQTSPPSLSVTVASFASSQQQNKERALASQQVHGTRTCSMISHNDELKLHVANNKLVPIYALLQVGSGSGHGRAQATQVRVAAIINRVAPARLRKRAMFHLLKRHAKLYHKL